MYIHTYIHKCTYVWVMQLDDGGSAGEECEGMERSGEYKPVKKCLEVKASGF